jgi:hypothetical protein
MLFSNLLVAIALTVLFPLCLMGLLAAGEWLERRTLATEEVVPRRLRRMEAQPPEAVEAMVLEETAHVVAQYWSATGRPAPPVPPNGGQPAAGPSPRPASLPQPAGRNGGRHLRRPAAGRAGRHERRR